MTNMTETKYLKQVNSLKYTLQKSLQILRLYDWLVDSYVLDFYVNNHWHKLPNSWRNCLEHIKPEKLCDLLVSDSQQNTQHMWPLSLLALKMLLKELCISRVPKQEQLPGSPVLSHAKLKPLFTKCVKPKKRHEIERMAGLCQRLCEDTNVDFILDFGAGLGHLARVLGYGYGIQVVCLEMQKTLSSQASTIDEQLEYIANKHLPMELRAAFRRPAHITLKLTNATQSSELLAIIKSTLKLKNDHFTFGIIGLHPCGDLGAILMRMLLNCEQATFLNFVGCCYMKLTTMNRATSCDILPLGYPLSTFLSAQPRNIAKLSYESLEISCHAAEMYYDRLISGDYEHLKIHSYRAAAERILVDKWPDLKHCGLRGGKHAHGLQFETYFYKAVEGLPAAKLPLTALQSTKTLTDLANWKRIVVFYTLRLMFAPLVESIILNDRILYMLEHGCSVSIDAIFNPRLSPRNHITSAVKYEVKNQNFIE